MSVRARLERLEKAAGVGVMCLSCKYSLILYADTLKHTRREDRHVRPCPDCGFPSFTILDGYSERERALIIETFYYPEEARPRTLAERQRNYAAQVYYFVHPRTRQIRAIAEREEKRLRDLRPPGEVARTQLKVLDEWNARRAEQAAARRLRLSEEEDEARGERKAKSAPTMAVVERERAAVSKVTGHADEGLYFLRVMAGLEPLIFGATLPETLATIEAHERGVREAEEKKERERVEREERWKRETEEREERYRREREERASAQEARLSGSSQPASAPLSRFRTNPAAAVPHSSMVVDPTAPQDPTRPDAVRHIIGATLEKLAPEPARMLSFPDPADPSRQMIVGRSIPIGEFYDPNHPDAVQFQRSTTPDPTQGLTVADIEAERERSRKPRLYYRPDDYEGDRRY